MTERDIIKLWPVLLAAILTACLIAWVNGH
jgi:hypothetical protein